MTIERYDAALRRVGKWKPCDCCGGASRTISPSDNRDQCISLDVTDFSTNAPKFRTANLVLLCLTCGKSDLYDYVLLNHFVYQAEISET